MTSKAWVFLALVLAGSFLAQLASALHAACQTTIDITCVIQSLDVRWGLKMPHRGWVPLQMALAAPLAGLSAERWGWCVFLVHGLNAGLVFTLSRLTGLPKSWSLVAALVFLAVPGLADSTFRPSNLTEFLLLTAFLLVTISYIRRAEAATWRRALPWLAAEVGAVVLGVGNKESFILYPALLAACDLTLAPGSRARTGREQRLFLVRRWLPHLILLPYVLLNTLPWILDRNIHPLGIQLSPGSVLAQWARASAALAMPWLSSRTDPASPPWAALLVPGALALAALRGGPALRFQLLMGLVLAAPVGALGTRFDEPYAYHLWPAMAMGTCLVLSAARSRWPGLLAGLWLIGLAVLQDRSRYPTPCAASPAMVSAIAAAPQQACSPQAEAWRVPRELAEEHLALRCAWLERARGAFPEAAACCSGRGLEERWQCFGEDLAGEAPMGEEAASVMGILRQLLAIRCGRLDVKVRLESVLE
ncbi:MAG: hypothetical protein HY924_17160 [Elusimicrobia bacterium]|nr:hypothetical protein [Elusimicrobiota bacterium]